MSVQNPRRLLDLERMHLLKEDALVYSYLEFLPRELFPPLFMDTIHGGTHQDLGIMVQACPFVCLPLGGSLPCLMWVPYEQGWKHLMSCWPRRFTPGEQDPGSLIGSWASRKRLLGWANSATHGQTRGL